MKSIYYVPIIIEIFLKSKFSNIIIPIIERINKVKYFCKFKLLIGKWNNFNIE